MQKVSIAIGQYCTKPQITRDFNPTMEMTITDYVKGFLNETPQNDTERDALNELGYLMEGYGCCTVFAEYGGRTEPQMFGEETTTRDVMKTGKDLEIKVMELHVD